MAKRNKQQAFKQAKRKQRERNRINQLLRRAAASPEVSKNSLEVIVLNPRANEAQKQRAREILAKLKASEANETPWQKYLREQAPKQADPAKKTPEQIAQEKADQEARAVAQRAKEAAEQAEKDAQAAAQAQKEAEEAAAKEVTKRARIAELKSKLAPYHALHRMPSGFWPKHPQRQFDEWHEFEEELGDLLATPEELKMRLAWRAEQAEEKKRIAEIQEENMRRDIERAGREARPRPMFDPPPKTVERLPNGQIKLYGYEKGILPDGTKIE